MIPHCTAQTRSTNIQSITWPCVTSTTSSPDCRPANTLAHLETTAPPGLPKVIDERQETKMATNLTLPTPPFIHAPGIENLRDAGGYPVESQNGKAVRRGILFRAADPTHLDEEGVAILQRLGITHIFDLRSLVELAKGREQPREWEGARRVPTPVFLDKDYSPEALALRLRNYSVGTEGFVRAYASILSGAISPDNAYRPFQTILEHLASDPNPPTPILIHCSAGKDSKSSLHVAPRPTPNHLAL